MAEHFYPESDGAKIGQDLLKYVNSPRLISSAKKGIEILKEFEILTVWKVQCKDPSKMVNNAWYIGFKDIDDPFIINYTITPSNIDVVFRYSQYLPSDIFDKMKCAKGSIWKYGDINTYSHKFLTNAIKMYLNNIESDFYSKNLKMNGRSFVECLIYDDLSTIYPDILIERNKRLDAMRSEKNKPLEFDIYIPNLSLAIEVQGPQHFRNIYGDNKQLKKNDQVKVQWSSQNSTNLMWINWENYNRKMIHKFKKERLNILKNKINSFLSDKEYFYYWE